MNRDRFAHHTMNTPNPMQPAGRAALLPFFLLFAVVSSGQGAAQSDGSDHEKSREHLLEDVVQSWQRPGAAPTPAPAQSDSPISPPLQEKLESIVVPAVNFTNLELNRVVPALSALAEEFDAADRGSKGVNLVLLDPANANPRSPSRSETCR